jgi:hypothetical protein
VPARSPAARRSGRRPREWAVDLEVREDETSTWVSTAHLPAAAVGDGVTVRSTHLPAARHGTVVETLNDETRGRFHRVAFRPDRP